MRLDGEARLLIAVAALALCAAATASGARPPEAAEASRRFQRLVGGLGLGPALDISRCAPAFDPRVGAVCPERVGAIPVGDVFSSEHAGALLPP